MAKFSTRLLSALLGGLMLFVLLFFTGLLIEAALNVLGALKLYVVPKWSIPIVMGAFGFTEAMAYELSRRLDEEATTK